MFWSFPFLKGLSKAYLAEAAELAMYCAWTRWGSDMGTPLYFALVKQFWTWVIPKTIGKVHGWRMAWNKQKPLPPFLVKQQWKWGFWKNGWSQKPLVAIQKWCNLAWFGVPPILGNLQMIAVKHGFGASAHVVYPASMAISKCFRQGNWWFSAMEFGYAIRQPRFGVVLVFFLQSLRDGHQNWALPWSNTQDPIHIKWFIMKTYLMFIKYIINYTYH